MKNDPQILIYQSSDGDIRIDVSLEEETVWLSQMHMAELFGKNKRTISEHIRNLFDEGELDEQVVLLKVKLSPKMYSSITLM